MDWETIDVLPRRIEQDDPRGGVLRPWVRNLSLRHQGVIITALRGCDTAPKEDPSKFLTAMVRRAVLNPFDARESESPLGFFGFHPDRLKANLDAFFHSLDQYPLHYVMHLMHCCQVIGYCSPEYQGKMAAFFESVYHTIVGKFHLNHESLYAMDRRLTEDRIAKGTVERDIQPPNNK